MSETRRRAIGGLKPGDRFTITRTFTREETEEFGDLTRDYNPVHYEQRFADLKGFPGLICHGLLVGSMICEVGGQLAWLASGMNFQFLEPVYFGDTITCTLTITEIDGFNRAQAEAVFVNQHGQRVVEAVLEGRLPGRDEQETLAEMVEAGDPTNRLAGKG